MAQQEEADAGLTAADVDEAARRVRGHVRRTPVLRLEADALATRVPVALKLESQQVTGTFKARNAFSLLLAVDVPPAGAVTASGGNFGLAMAHAARRLGHRMTVFVPASAPEVKLGAIRSERARVEVLPGPAAEAFAAAERHADESGALLAHPYDLPEIAAGAGSCAVELEEQCPELDTLLVAVGGGGLIGGIATWYGGRVRVVAVETHGTAALHESRRAGERIEHTASGVAMSALGAPRIGAIGWAAQQWVDDCVLVADEAVVAAQRRLWGAARLVTEPGGAVALAALTSGAYVPAVGERVGVLVCGANADPSEVAAAEAT